MHLSIRLKPNLHESLFSYIVRLANRNYLQPKDIWRYCQPTCSSLRKKAVDTLNFRPERILNITNLSGVAKLTTEEIFNMTFYNLLQKFRNYQESAPPRFMLGLLHMKYYFCEECLREEPYHQLLWLVKDIRLCAKHKLPLRNTCPYCNNTIFLKDVVAFTYCPKCGHCLISNRNRRNIVQSNISIKQQTWLIENYTFFINKSNSYLNCRELGVKLLYILNKFNPILDKDRVVQSLYEYPYRFPYLLQYSLNSYKQRSLLELPFLLYILYMNQCSVEELFNLVVPVDFITSLDEKKHPKLLYVK